MDLVTPDGNIGHFSSERGSHGDFDDNADEDHESKEDEFPGKITYEGNKSQVMRNEWREIEPRWRIGVRAKLMVLLFRYFSPIRL